MSHFLARLVDRARGTAPRAEPIIAPRFASVSSLGTESLSEISAEVEARPAAPKPAQPAAKVQSPRLGQKPEAPAGNGRDEEKQARDTASERLLVPQFQKEPEPLLVRQTETVRQRETVGEEKPLLAGPAGRPRLIARASSPRRTGTASPAAARNLETRPRSRFAPNEPQPEAPIVRVTIGRIDVRATPATAQPARKPPPTAGPRLTLEAYEKERREGKR